MDPQLFYFLTFSDMFEAAILTGGQVTEAGIV